MPDTDLARYAGIFASRLEMLANLLDQAETQWRESGRDLEALCAARLADDMFPFPHQIAFACKQADDFLTWQHGAPPRPFELPSLAFAELKPHVASAIEALRGQVPQTADNLLESPKRIVLGGSGMYLELPGRRYVDDWLMPNFYFHLVTAYDILRHEGVKIGKIDFMAHLAGDVRRV